MIQSPLVTASDFNKMLFESTPVIDVRAPVEFAQGHIPGAINLPILNNEHREEIGTLYKQRGQAAAVSRGHELVSGEYKAQMISRWKQYVEENPKTILTCFRGGQRSQLAQSWLQESSQLVRPRIEGGYKAFRQHLIDELTRMSNTPMIVVSGPTGSGKTRLIEQVKKFRPAVDLEALANHRGSAFGHHSTEQPSQADYENQLAKELILMEEKLKVLPLILEDESRMIGRTAQPEKFFDQLRTSSLIYLDETVESRVSVIFDEYILKMNDDERTKAYARYQVALQKISAKLGGIRFQELHSDLNNAIKAATEHNELKSHQVWIEKLLIWYYDPLYLRSFERRNPNVIFRGSRKDAIEFLKQSLPT